MRCCAACESAEESDFGIVALGLRGRRLRCCSCCWGWRLGCVLRSGRQLSLHRSLGLLAAIDGHDLLEKLIVRLGGVRQQPRLGA